ncbi:homeobox-leucine zipper protein HDG8-like [Solanum verrucosum]|uniref:homeobox-leucine zipper protein HDG8-like n=1 Tax=Solanum verrucosum TaxID=315347 RepID=UPI0020D01CC8|nr:homeobox-leucine zipper protein HDG8-like [Solanum verrucosum]
MADSGKKQVGESSISQKGSKRKGQGQRHSVEATQKLEAFFKKCRFPDEDQRNQLAIEAGLDPDQIKGWFQNKRTQTKTKNERSDNQNFQNENEKFRREFIEMKEAMENNMRSKCDGPLIGEEERAGNIEKLKINMQRLREERKRIISNIISSYHEKSFVMDSTLAPPNSTLGSLTNSSDECLLRQTIGGSPIGYNSSFHPENNNDNNNVRAHSINIKNIPIISQLEQENYGFHHDNNGEKSVIFEIVVPAINEMLGLVYVNEPLWVKSSVDEGWLIHRESYDRTFPNSNRPYKSSTARIESSRSFGVVPMTAIDLIKNFRDPSKWMNMFPTIVTKARIVDVLDSGNTEVSIQLMYEKLHILSPLVEARDFVFIRCCKQLDQTTWIMVDVSYDLFKEIKTCAPSYAWKFPSGCVIQDTGDGKSMVAWIEHVQIDEKCQVNHIFRDLLCGRQTYGAERWIVTLQRMSERYNFAMPVTYATTDDSQGVNINFCFFNDISEGVKNVMNLSQRMVKSFCETLSMTEKLGFSTSSHLNNEDRVSIRKNEEITQPKGFIATAATSLWVPLSFETIFNLLKDNNTRCQWDALSGGNNVTERDRVLTGTCSKNCITFIQVFPMPIGNNMLVLQESSIDKMGAFLIYGPIDSTTYTSFLNGVDGEKVVILPSGIIISPDGRLASDMNSNGNAQNGSILTVAFQKLICANNSISQDQHMEAMVYIQSLLSSTVSKIKATLGCSD